MSPAGSMVSGRNLRPAIIYQDVTGMNSLATFAIMDQRGSTKSRNGPALGLIPQRGARLRLPDEPTRRSEGGELGRDPAKES